MLRFHKSVLFILTLPVSLACSPVATARAADAPSAPAAQAPASSSVDGKFQRFLLSPRGDVDGLLLADGSIARFGPHALVTSELAALRSGDTLHVEGEGRTAPTGRVLTRASVRKGTTVIVRADLQPPPPPDDGEPRDRGPRGKKHRPPPPPDRAGHGPAEQGLVSLTVTSQVDRFSLDREGKIDGILMKDGTSARVGKAASLEPLGISRGDTLTLTGRGGSYTLGKSLHIETIRLPNGKIQTLEPPPGDEPPPPPVAP